MKEETKQALDLVTKALDKANQNGVFNLIESSEVLNALKTVAIELKPKEETEETKQE